VALGTMREGHRILVFNRKTSAVMPVLKSKNAPGWKFGEPDGEASYTNCLLTTLAKRSPVRVQVASGEPAPDLSQLAVAEKELEWAADLPFRYDRIDTAKVIAIVRQFAKLGDALSGTLKVKLATGGGAVETVAFALELSADARKLEIEKVAA